MNIIEEERVFYLNDKEFSKGLYVLYWMNHSFRSKYNHALTFAISMANQMQLPLLVFTGIFDFKDERNFSHYKFMLEGLLEVQESLKELSIKHLVWFIDPVIGTVNLSKNAAVIITDTGYLKESIHQSSEVAKAVKCSFISVESDVIVPVRTASEKGEYSAATFRPRLKRKLDFFLKAPPELKPVFSSMNLKFKNINLMEPVNIYNELKITGEDYSEKKLIGGYSQARRRLDSFILENLDLYHEKRNEPSIDMVSHMSSYLRYGHISPIEIALMIIKTNSLGRESYLEELIIRRELSVNFVFYNENYDNLRCLPKWALETLISHESYPRDFIYTVDDFEKCSTHDLYWNAAQFELKNTGEMHGYMRMYWGKKIIEWSDSPEKAFEYMVYLNNKYALDGNSPNSYAGIAWCFGKHDRAWKERPIFGKVRYMNESGLKRKFNMEGYIKRVKYHPGTKV